MTKTSVKQDGALLARPRLALPTQDIVYILLSDTKYWTLAKSGKSEPQLGRGTETQFNNFIGGAFPGSL
ncbi:MAG: hypothetical protein Q8O74_03505, partial [bacterium]|nr:hypothetical protein [bacterium]